MTRSSSVHTTTDNTQGRTELQRKAPIDRLVNAIELGYRKYDRQAAADELRQLDASGNEIIGRLFIHYLAEEFFDSTSWLELWAEHFAKTGADQELATKLKEVFDDDRYPLNMAEFWESEIEFCQGRPDEIEECRQKARDLRQLAAAPEGGAA